MRRQPLVAREARHAAVLSAALGEPPKAKGFEGMCDDVNRGEYSRFSVRLPAGDPAGVALVLQTQELPTVHDPGAGNMLPRELLPYAVAALAGVPAAWSVTSSQPVNRDPYLWMQAQWYEPRMEGARRMTLEEASARVCRCKEAVLAIHGNGLYLHRCPDRQVWEAFQSWWRTAFRNSLLTFMKPNAALKPPAGLTAVAAQAADLAVHVRCGDIMHSQLELYGFLGISAYKKALEGLKSAAPVRIRVIMAPTKGSGVRGVDAANPWHAKLCPLLSKELVALLESTFHPAEVTLDQTGSLIVAWAHLTMAKRALCGPSTFCLWPTMAASRGYLADTPLFFNGTKPKLDGVTYLSGRFLTAKQITKSKFGPREIVDWIANN